MPRRFPLLMCACLVGWVSLCGEEERPDRHLLVLHSYHQADWTESLLAGMREVLGSEPDLVWSIEYMDTKRPDSPEELQALLDQLAALYRVKYADQPFDVILTTDDNALRFALARRDALFGGAPIVFCGVNRYDPAELAGHAEVTGVVERVDIAETLALARRCRPGARTVWAICDNTATSRINTEALRRAVAGHQGDLAVEELRGLSRHGLAERLAGLPAGDFAFFIAYWNDEAGQQVSPDEVGEILAASAVPVFGRSEWMIGRHQVGGYCVTGRRQGAAAARLAERVLAGERAGDIPVITDSPNAWLFDFAELRRHGIDLDLLPPGSEIVGRPPRAYAIDKPLFWVGASALVVLGLLTILLTLSILVRRRTQRRLARSEERYRRIADNCWDYICELDEAGDYRYCNAAYRQLGYDPATLVGTSPAALLHPDDREQVMAQVRDLDPERSRLELTYRALDAKGTVRWFESTVTACRDDEGRLRYTAISRDITERLLAQGDRERFFATSMDLLCIADFDGTFKQLNPPWSRVLGWSERELLRIPWLDLVHEEDRAATAKAGEMLRNGEPVYGFECRYRCKDGSFKWLSWNSYPLVEEGRIYATAQDVTERKRVDAELQESERRFRTIIQSSPMGIHLYELCGDELVLIDANPAADRFTGVDNQDLIGQTIGNAFPNLAGTEIPRRYLEAARDGTPWMTTSFQYDDDRIAGAFDVYAFQTSPGRMAVFFLNVTDRLQAEEQLRESREQFMQAQKMEAVGQLAGGVAHDFNNMLGGILGAAELLAEEVPAGSGAAGLVGTIRQAAERAAELTRQLLSYSRRGRLVTAVVDVHAVIGDALAILRHSLDKRIELVERLAAKRSCIVGDPAQIQSAILNLGINARDAMPDGGVLTVATRTLPADADDTVPGRLELRVTDTGSGMSPAVMKRIFEPFFTTKDVGAGTGLGLAAVEGTVRAHGGDITVDSTEGKGTTFTILLPVTASIPHHPPSRHSAPAAPVRADGTVLVVDDEPLIRQTLQTMLEAMGFTVLVAEDGLEGLERYGEHREDIDLVILDMIMPRLGGRECFARLKELDPEATVVISTGFSDDASDRDLVDQGLAGFLRKPFTSAELKRVLGGVLPPRD